MEQSLAWAGSFIAQFGYVGLGLSLAVNCLGIPIASELTLPLAGIAIKAGDFDPFVTLMAVVVAQMAGFTIAYIIARHAGVGLIERYGHFMFISHKQIVTGQRLFRKHGPIIMLIGLCMPGMHGYMGYSAGLAKLKVPVFLVVALAGTVIWSLGLLGLGFLFGDSLPALLAASNNASTFVGIGLAVAGVIFWYSRRQKRRTSPVRAPRPSTATAKSR